MRECDLIAHYVFKEDSTQKYSGIFEGDIDLQITVDNHYKVGYDNLMLGADGYSNNQFTGTWTSYDKKIKKVCNWGDTRVSGCGDLDMGIGEFIPDPKYIKNGWEGFAADNSGDSARKPKEWWK